MPLMLSSTSRRARSGLSVLALLVAIGCQPTVGLDLDSSITEYRHRMILAADQARTEDSAPRTPREPVAEPSDPNLPARRAILAQPTATTQPAPDEVLLQIADPVDAPRILDMALDALRSEQTTQGDQRVVRLYERVYTQAKEYLTKLRRERQVPLSLTECVERAIGNNYTVRIQGYNPAISQTQIVEAEAAFDAEFYLDWSWANLDRATVSQFQSGYSDTRQFKGGVRQLLSTGTQVNVGMEHVRSKSDFPAEVQAVNPVYNTNIFAELRQPLLRNFGIDVNRTQIEIRKVEYKLSIEDFITRVRDTVFDVESAYWQLSQARRTVAILAMTTAQNLVTYQNMVERLDHDATQVEVANAESQFQSAYVRLLESIKTVRDAEDRLKNLINDPELKLSDGLELLPTETPFLAALVLDQFAEVRTALDRRSEIRRARDAIDIPRISANFAKNQILPQLDLVFRYDHQGIGSSADNSWDDFIRHRFLSYTLGASFVYNFGERKARAQWTRAKLQEAQAVVQLNQVTDAVVEEVNNAVRTLMVRYDQLPPALTAVHASMRNLRSLQARTQRIDPNYLQTELQAVEQLANARRTLLQVVTDYNVGLLQLEKSKGTLLDYNNIVVVDDVRSPTR